MIILLGTGMAGLAQAQDVTDPSMAPVRTVWPTLWFYDGVS